MRALHKRIQLISQSEIQCKFACGLPAIAGVPAELPFASGHLDVLQSFSGRLVEAEEKCRVPVELIRRRTPIQGGNSTIEGERSAGTEGACLGLPLIELIANHVETEAEFVRSARPGHVVAVGPTLVVAIERDVIGHLTEA